MTTYLDKVGSTYYIRRVVPLELRPYFLTDSGRHRTEFKVSLGTKDRREAEERCRLKAVEFDGLFREAREKSAAGIPPPRPITAQVRARIEDRERAELEAEELRSLDLLEEEFEWEEREELRQEIVRELQRPGLTPRQRALRDLISEYEFLPKSEQQTHDAARQREADAAAAEWAEKYFAPKAPPYPALIELFDAYVAERKPAPATIKRWRPVLDHLVKWVGHDDAARLSRKDVVAWKDALLAERAQNGRQLRAAVTVKETYLAALSVVLGFAAGNARIEQNVAEDVTVLLPKKVKLRDPGFSSDEALLILRAALKPQPATLSPGNRLARRWIPWLCAYTGARVGEMAQLRKEDVQHVEGVWVLRITPDAGRVKNNSARTVPIHPHLIEQGFVTLVEGRKAGPIFYDPSRARGGSDGNPHFKKVGERLAKWVRELGVEDPEVQPNHAWRHLFKTTARSVGMDVEVRDALAGHAPKTEGQKYGVFKVDALIREIAKLPRFDVHQ